MKPHGGKFSARGDADCRLWWLGWRDYFAARYIFLSNLLRVGRVSKPMRVSGVIPVAHKSPRISMVDLNRDLPSLPLDGETGVLGKSLDMNDLWSSGQAHVSAEWGVIESKM